MKCTVNKSDNMGDWWTIDRAEHDGRHWMERTEYGMALMCSSRLGNADIEGTAAEMLAIAAAIERGESESFRRCAAKHTADGYLMSSPRNSLEPTLITHDEAKELAADIRAKVTIPASDESTTT